MMTFEVFTWRAAIAGRWVARICGTLLFLLFATLLIGEGPPPLFRMPFRDQLHVLSLCSVFVGLALAWWKPQWGGLLTLVGWAGMWAVEGRPPFDPFTPVAAIMGALHLVCWFRLRGPEPRGAALSIPKQLIWGFWGLFALFVLLAASEILMEVPLLASIGPPPIRTVGAWSGTLPSGGKVELTVSADGSLSGTIADAQIVEGKLRPNRSWFGRLLDLRSDYMITGTLSQPVDTAGDHFRAHLKIMGRELTGALALTSTNAPQSRPTYRKLTLSRQ